MIRSRKTPISVPDNLVLPWYESFWRHRFFGLVFRAGGTLYRLRYSRPYGHWHLSFRSNRGRKIFVTLDRNTRPEITKIRVNGYTWQWSSYYKSHGWFLVDAPENVPKRLPENVAKIVESALVQIQPYLTRVHERQLAAEEAYRIRLVELDRKKQAEQQAHYKDVLESLN